MQKTTEQFILQAKQVHGDKLYDYSSVEYIRYNKNVTLYCNRCNKYFEINPSNHLLQKQGCRKCNSKKQIEKMRKTTQDFIDNAIKIHEDKYDYSLVEYTGNKNKITIICKKHGNFDQTPNHHLRGRGCPKCGMETRSLKLKEKLSNWNHSGWESNGLNSLTFKAFSVYVIECWSDNERFIKIGKTFSGVNNRFTNVNMPYQWKLLQEHIGSAEYISNLEHELHRQFKEYKYIPIQNFTGATECFNINIKDICVNTS